MIVALLPSTMHGKLWVTRIGDGPASTGSFRKVTDSLHVEVCKADSHCRNRVHPSIQGA